MTRPFEGVKILDFTQVLAGPYASYQLALLGADVIKVERREGEDMRRTPLSREWADRGLAPAFQAINGNKRSLTLDLQKPEAIAIVKKLATSVDVVMENFRPGVMDKLGIGYEALSAINPKLIYCAVSGFGQTGPDRLRPGYDGKMQALSGIMAITGHPETGPTRAGFAVCDVLSGATAAFGVSSALYQRDRTGKGQLVKSALFESTVFLMGQHMAGQAVSGEKVPPMPVRRGGWGIYQTFKTADDDQVFVGVTSNNHWARFCQEFRRPDWLADPRLASNEDRVAARDWLIPAVAELLVGFDKPEIMRRCEAAGIPFAPVARPDDLFDHPHLNAADGLLEVTIPGDVVTRLPRLPIEMGGGKPGLRREAPRLGEHTREILQAAGLADAEIAVLAQRGVIADAGDADARASRRS